MLDDCYTNIKEQKYAKHPGDVLIPSLGIITTGQIDILYEILRKHIPDKFDWEKQYYVRWIFLTLTSFASVLGDKLTTDVTQIMPLLLTFPIFEKQRKAINAIMKPT
jgi:hypothetical protein